MSRLHKLEVQNIQKIKDVVYTFDPANNALVVCGKNGQGKSSLMNAIAWAFCGISIVPEDPIREGEETGHVECTTDEYIVRLDFKYNKARDITTKLIVTPISGGKEIASPQTKLNQMLQNKTINPVSLLNEHPRKLRDILVGLVNLSIDLDEHDKERQRLYDERTIVGRVADQKKALLREIPLPDGWEELPKEHVSAIALNKKYQAAVDKNAENQRIREGLELAKKDVVLCENKIVDLEQDFITKANDVKEVEQEIVPAKTEAEYIHAKIQNLVGVDTDTIEKEIKKLQEKLEAGRRKNMENALIAESLKPAQGKVSSLEAQKERLIRERDNIQSVITNANESKKAAETKVVDIQFEVNDLTDVDTSAITQQIERIQETNDAISTVKSHFASEREWDKSKTVVEDYTELIAIKDREKDEAISMAKFPVKGLSVDSKGIIFNNRRFEQASTAEQMDILVSIHMALNPGARFIIIHDAATLDKDTMAHLIKKAEKEDFDIIFERIEADEEIEGASQLVIHDGELLAKQRRLGKVAA